MGILTVDCDTGWVSDGYHTFNELYAHRCLLFCGLMNLIHRQGGFVWRQNDPVGDETGWILGGIALPTGIITYHMNRDCEKYILDIPFLESPPAWDGHTSDDVLFRLREWMPSCKIS